MSESSERFRVARGKMLVVAPDSRSEVRPVLLVYDQVNDSYGIQLVGETQLKGYSFFIPSGDFEATKDRGTPQERLRTS